MLSLTSETVRLIFGSISKAMIDFPPLPAQQSQPQECTFRDVARFGTEESPGHLRTVILNDSFPI